MLPRFIILALLFTQLQIGKTGHQTIPESFDCIKEYRTIAVKLKVFYWNERKRCCTTIILDPGFFFICPPRTPLKTINGKRYALAINVDDILRFFLEPTANIPKGKMRIYRALWIARLRRIIEVWEEFEKPRDITYAFRDYVDPDDLQVIFKVNPDLDYENGFPTFDRRHITYSQGDPIHANKYNY